MKIYTKIVYDINDNIIEEESFEYNGPIAKADAGTMMLASSVFSAAKTYTDIQYVPVIVDLGVGDNWLEAH